MPAATPRSFGAVPVRDRAGAWLLTVIVYGGFVALLLTFQTVSTRIATREPRLTAMVLPPPARTQDPPRPKTILVRKPLPRPDPLKAKISAPPLIPELPAPAQIAPLVDLPKTAIAEIGETSSATGPAAQSGTGGQQGSAGGTGGGATYYEGQWRVPPGYDDLARYLPRHAPPMGWAQIMCRTAGNYRVTDCYALEEAPEGSGFAKTMRDASATFQVLPPRYKGKDVVGGWVRLRMDFLLRKK